MRPLFCLIGTLSIATLAQAEPAAPKFGAEVSGGVVADSDVGLAELDQSSSEGDLAVRLKARLSAEFQPAEKLTMRASYELNDTRYQDFDAFNLQTHLGTAEAAYDFGKTDAGVTAAYANARLDGDSYLDLTQVSPYVTRAFGNMLVLRGAYVRTERDFKTEDDRDGTADELQADAFFLLDGTRQYVSVGAKGGSNDAQSEAFSYSNAGVKARYLQRFDLMGRAAKLRLGAEYEQRDFDGAQPGTTLVREDELAAATSDLSVAVAGPLSVDLGYEYRQRDSNLAAAVYDEHVGSVELKLTF